MLIAKNTNVIASNTRLGHNVIHNVQLLFGTKN